MVSTARRHALCALLWLLGAALPAQAAVNALLERNNVALGESVRLVIETDQRTDGDGPDLAPLARDFDVLATSQSTQVQIANGQQAVTVRWLVELLPKRAGRLTVPALRVGAASTQPIDIEVTPAPAAGTAGGDLFMEAEVEPGNHYVQGQLLYRVRLYAAVPVLGGSLSPPEAANTQVTRLGEDKAFTATRDGRRYDVIERRYALFPQRSGLLRIGAARFTGQLASGGSGVPTMDRLLNRGRRATATAPPVEVEVRAEQAGFAAGEWLPARELVLQESWPDGLGEMRVGEPVTRVLRVEARGLQASHITLPPAVEQPGLKRYPDALATDDGDDGEWTTAVVEQREALMPTRAGSLVLPEIRLRWWDVVADREQVAVVPPRTITVLPALPAASAAPDAPAEADVAQDARTTTVTTAGWWPVAAAVSTLLWLATAFGWWHSRRVPARRAAAGATESGGSTDLRRWRGAVLAACRRDDAAAARAALLAFGRAAWPHSPPHGLRGLASRLGDARLVDELRRLDECLYAARGAAWNGSALGALVDRHLVAKRTNPPATGDLLGPLNPPPRTPDERLEA